MAKKKKKYPDIKYLSELPPILDTGYVAYVLRVTPQQCRRLFASGEIKAVRVGAMWRVLRENLIEYLTGKESENKCTTSH
ncbi:MAG: helix-turn-helix domain-containing protein [Oscillospiraceae bacterium]|nr:helix-turn-helix domain-containing protein [Oscillospiraceae bacterium]